ncbi:FtsX-like permease family protein [Hymenobacter sp. IS2118]|uniref:FtsX-like permease family protein n=1 Tax=Hymenobacter sp. IS2118 TaxID=1505605 RepID=UPI0005556D40|nr:FtsX-like permease family protein [Hymenobacter sp. IS2118]
MIRHLFTLMWNRKRANGLLLLEIVLAFVVLFAVGSVAVYNWTNYRAPLGFTYEQVWEVDMSPGNQPRREQFATLQRVLQRVRSMPGVVGVARHSENTPFSFNDSSTEFQVKDGTDKLKVGAEFYHVGPELRDVMSLRLVAGRWFDRRDEAAGRRKPVVITELMQASLFPKGRASAVGQTLVDNDQDAYEVVGIISSYRAQGELAEPYPAVLAYVGPQDSAHAWTSPMVRVQPGSGAALEKRLGEEIRAVSGGWVSSVTSLPDQRLTQLKFRLTPPAIMAVICVFLLVNVALGLFGVLWLNINQRRGELGVRRAMGAPAGAISWQVVGELLVLTTFGLLLGLLLAVQFPLLGVFDVAPGVYGLAMLLATGILYVLAIGCAFYPSRLAAAIQPAVALREE